MNKVKLNILRNDPNKLYLEKLKVEPSESNVGQGGSLFTRVKHYLEAQKQSRLREENDAKDASSEWAIYSGPHAEIHLVRSTRSYGFELAARSSK